MELVVAGLFSLGVFFMFCTVSLLHAFLPKLVKVGDVLIHREKRCRGRVLELGKNRETFLLVFANPTNTGGYTIWCNITELRADSGRDLA